MKRRKKYENCKWLRDHSTSTKPSKLRRYRSRDDEVYWELTNGQWVHEYNLKRMGL